MKWLLSLLRRTFRGSKRRHEPAPAPRKFRVWRLPLYLEWLEERLAPANVTWNAQGDGVSWSDPHNWSGNALPGSADDVFINATPAGTVQFTAGSATIKS